MVQCRMGEVVLEPYPTALARLAAAKAPRRKVVAFVMVGFFAEVV